MLFAFIGLNPATMLLRPGISGNRGIAYQNNVVDAQDPGDETGAFDAPDGH